MAHTEAFIGQSAREGWRFAVYHYGSIHGWLHEATGDSAMVLAGEDSFQRAGALIAGEAEPAEVMKVGHSRMYLDSDAVRLRELARHP